ncbi:alpha/beta hydrolase [Nocardia sienata]|uniref:alpha/beta hydrolase n=1 Tax=Nocardia sienata TaxID=248552 RepID=UPI000A79C99B|nr:alpha/beta hydrolase [Nocardia sienata]
MNRFGPDGDFSNIFPLGIGSGIRDAHLLAERLNRIIGEMGEGISETLYRRTREVLLRGEHKLMIADADNNSVLKRLMSVTPPAPSTASRLSVGGIRESPAAVHRWWSGLSAAEKQERFRADFFIGNTDGIPQKERDIYNRQNLDRLQVEAHLAGDRKRAELYDDLKSLLGGRPYLLSHLDEDGRFVISRGNPDLADHSVVFLQPANNFNAVGFAEDTITQIRQSAALADPKAMTSVTFWGNYDNPTTITETMFPQFAADGAAAVRSYHDGLRVTHQGPPAHTTTIGYSYGSVLAGHAAGHGHTLDTDDLIFFGSWGTGVGHVSDLRLAGVEPARTADHVSAALAPNDPLQHMPDTHDKRPTDSEYGAPNFAAGSARGVNSLNLLDHEVDNYLSSANPSSRSIGLIMTGHRDQVAWLQ